MSTARRVVFVVIAAVPVAIVGVYLVAWLRLEPIEPVEFFAPRDGEHRPLVFAHQGGEGVAPSNTMVAFQMAAATGADVLDSDMHMTADGVLVLIHDETVDRTSNGTGAVRDLTMGELLTLDFGYDATADDGSHPFRGQGIGIVTVEELFTEFGDGAAGDRQLRFGIEIKQTTAEAATELCDLIRRFGYEHRVLISSFAQPNMDAFRNACPDVATSATEDEVRTYYIAHRAGLQGLITPNYEAFQVPEYSDNTLILSPGFVEDARAHNLAVVPWTINDEEDLQRMIALEVAGINTDYPERLIDLITDPGG